MTSQDVAVNTDENQDTKTCQLKVNWHGMEILLSDRNYTCNIMHEDTKNCTVKNLPSAWTLATSDGMERSFCCATLPCSHHYNVSALALHFLCNHMRCAVCRRGTDDKMPMSVLPKHMRGLFLKCVEEVSSRDDDTAESVAGFHFNAIRYDPMVYMNNFQFILEETGDNASFVVQQSPCVTQMDALSSDSEGILQIINCRPQYWMSRHLQRTVSGNMENTFLRVGITHPLLSLPIMTETLSVNTHANMQNINLCATWAFHEPVGSVCISRAHCVFKMRLGVMQDLMTRSVNDLLRVHFQGGY